MEHFTHYVQEYATQSQMALMKTKALWDNFIIHYGLPEKIFLNQGKNTKSELIADLYRLMETKKLAHTIPK